MKTTQEKKDWSINKRKDLTTRLDRCLSECFTDKEKMNRLMKHYNVLNIYHYSFYNCCLVYSQGGSLVQSYRKWQELKRQVKQGEKARIYILVPIFKKTNEIDETTGKNKQELAFFTMIPVFDISQTDGDPLQYEHNSEKQTEWDFNNLIPDIQKLTGKPIVLKPIVEARGYCSDKEIAVSEFSNNIDRIKTLFHEAAHSLLEHTGNSNLQKGQKEIEAECCAYLTLSALGIPFDLCEAYISSYKDAGHTVRTSLIIKTTEKIIKAINKTEELSLAKAA